MKTFKFNVGLNNNPYTSAEIQGYMEHHFDATGTKVELGEWDGQQEPTIIFEVQAKSSEWANYLAQAMCIRFTQTAVGMKCVETGVGNLVYDPRYKGERYTFDPKYFID